MCISRYHSLSANLYHSSMTLTYRVMIRFNPISCIIQFALYIMLIRSSVQFLQITYLATLCLYEKQKFN